MALIGSLWWLFLIGTIAFGFLQMRSLFGRVRKPSRLLDDVADGGGSIFLGFVPIWICSALLLISVVINIIDYIKA